MAKKTRCQNYLVGGAPLDKKWPERICVDPDDNLLFGDDFAGAINEEVAIYELVGYGKLKDYSAQTIITVEEAV